jgi:lipopolysaccharide/colanic/teichoic acid biosynthesis glycosyltransferase
VAKRTLDVVVSAVAVVASAPVLAVISGLLLVTLGRPVLFTHRRAGLRGKTFRLIKFRTMRDLWDDTGNLLPDGERLTGLGRFLRSTSLDELPTLFNVLKGDMSLVGPRPLLPEYVGRYTPEQARRLEVRPGITGWAQVKGRNAISWEEKFARDVWYVDHWSMLIDLKILALTIPRVLLGRGISQPGHATMSEFTGGAGSGAAATASRAVPRKPGAKG